MPDTFVESYRARWVDMDFNQHMRNAAFLGCAEETRLRFMESRGFSADELKRQQIGPVVLEDKLVYKREIALLESFSVDIAVAAATADGRRLRVRNRFHKVDGTLCATVESVVLWFDLAERRPVLPPDALREIWATVVRTDDYEVWT